MDTSAFSRDGMSGTARRHITNYGTSKYDLESSHHFCREPIGPWRRAHINTNSHSRWHSSEGNYKESRDSSDATMVWERESTYEKSQKKPYSMSKNLITSNLSRGVTRRSIKLLSTWSTTPLSHQPGLCLPPPFPYPGCLNHRDPMSLAINAPIPTTLDDHEFLKEAIGKRSLFSRGNPILKDALKRCHEETCHDAQRYIPKSTRNGARENTTLPAIITEECQLCNNSLGPGLHKQGSVFCRILWRSQRSRSRSPAYRFERASVNDRRGRITTYDFRNDKPRSTSTIPCKFFATGNCRNGSFCRFSHNDRTLDSFSYYKPDDHMQGIDSRVCIASPRALDINVSPYFRDENEGLGEQRAMRSYADDNAATENSFIAHRIDSDEPTKDNGRSHLALTADSSSGMVVSESRGTAIRGADIEGSITCTENHLPTLSGTSRKPDVLDTLQSEAASSNQGRMGSEQILRLTNTLARFLENGKQLPELYAALGASNALGFMQSFVSGSAGPDVPASLSDQYDPVTDSLELVNSVISEQQDGNVSASQLLLTGSLGGDGLHGIDCKKAEPNVNRFQSSEKALSADCKNEEQSMLTAAEEGKGGGKLANNEGVGKAAEIKKNNDGKNLQTSENAPFSDCKNQEHIIVKVEKIQKGQDRGKLVNNEGDDKADKIKKNSDGKSFRAFKFALAEFVKELLCPTWKEGHINKEAYKTIVKNVVDKVIASVQCSHILQTKEKIDNYLSTSKPKILKLLQAYVEKVKEEKSNTVKPV